MLAVYGLWAIIGSEHIDYALFELQKLFKVFFVFVIIGMVLKQEFLFKIIQGFVLAIFFSTTISYIMFFYKPLLPYIPLELTGENVPFMMNYTQYATVLSITTGFLLHVLLTNHSVNKLIKFLQVTLFLFISGNLFIVGSRIGYLLFFISVVTVLCLIYKKNLKKILFLFLVLFTTGYVFAYFTIPYFQNRIQQAFTDIQELQRHDLTTSLGVRLGFIIYGIESVKNHLFFGVGTGDHVFEVRKNILMYESNSLNVESMLKNIPDSFGSTLHNQFLDLLLQFGIIGFIVFLNIFYQIYKIKPQQTFLRPLPYILIVNILIACFANPLFIYGDVERIFILLVALLIVPFEQTTLKEQEQKNIHAI